MLLNAMIPMPPTGTNSGCIAMLVFTFSIIVALKPKRHKAVVFSLPHHPPNSLLRADDLTAALPYSLSLINLIVAEFFLVAVVAKVSHLFAQAPKTNLHLTALQSHQL